MLSNDPAAVSSHSDTAWSIELFRGIAALMVLGVHYLAFVPGDGGVVRYFFTGVDFFFVLSGFVFAPYLVERQALHLPSFLVRRFFRLYPLYLLALVPYALLHWGEPQLPANFAKHVFMLHTLENHAIAFYLNPAFWSLPPEVEFYLVLPLLALLCRVRGGFVALVAIALALRWAVTWGLAPSSAHASLILSVHLPGVLLEFLLGALAYAWARGARSGRMAAWVVLLAGLALELAWGNYVAALLRQGGDALLNSNRWTRHTVGPVAAVGYAFIVAGTARAFSGVQVPASLVRLSLWMGGISYGVYLFHSLFPKLVEGRLPSSPVVGIACAVATVVVAAVLHRVYEAPLREFGREWGKRLRSRDASRYAAT